jgi:ADYC domain
MTRCFLIGIAGLCACSAPETTTDEQAGIQPQGTQLQGIQLQGTQLQGTTLQGFRFSGATQGGAALVSLRVEQGELVAEQDQVTLHGAALIGTHLYAEARDLAATPPGTAIIEYRITHVAPEDAKYDPSSTGSSFLYALEQRIDNTGAWQPACPVDLDGRRVAIPLAATWDEHGDRIESTSLFTLGCTSAVIAKCYRWGYRPWITGYGDLVTLHWACTRLARADYCGNGVSHTRNGTKVNVWDNLPEPGPIQRHGLLAPLGMIFEAGWSTHGAVCLSRARWLLDGAVLAAACPDRLVPPGVGETVCDTTASVLNHDPDAHLFNASYLNL